MIKTEIGGSGHQLYRVEWGDVAGGLGRTVGTGQRDTGKGGAKESLPIRKHIYLEEPSSLLTMHLGNPTTICVSVPVH